MSVCESSALPDYNGLGLRCACCGKEQPNNIAHLTKYAVHGRGTTEPPAPVSPRTASLKRTLVLGIVVLCCYSCTQRRLDRVTGVIHQASRGLMVCTKMPPCPCVL